jgi:deoxyribodipyrimidine photo-lyase
LPLFIFDTEILAKLEDRDDARVGFIHETLRKLNDELIARGSGLLVRHGKPKDVWKKLVEEFAVEDVVFNHDYEPYARERDDEITELLSKKSISVRSFKDQVVFEKLEVSKDDGTPYTVFTPYFRKWCATLTNEDLKPARVRDNFVKWNAPAFPKLKEFGFEPSSIELPSSDVSSKMIKLYEETRNYPAINGTSRLGVHLRFGTVSVRELARKARAATKDDVWLKELAWREFFTQILWNFPHVVKGPFRPEYSAVQFRHDETEFAAWTEGRTGYPIVDAGLRELNTTGFMHNRVRMIAASFLVKHLAIDWRWGEAYFARKLLDFELASNNGNWQWVAGTGCDAAPYFRVFNPQIQQKKFDRDGEYVKRWIPELGTDRYPQPIVDHVVARTRIMKLYSAGLGRKAPAPKKK